LPDSFACERYQGYYFSKPLEKDALIEYLDQTAVLSWVS